MAYGSQPQSLEFVITHLCPALSENEVRSLYEIWGGETLSIIWQILIHHENFSFKLSALQLVRQTRSKPISCVRVLASSFCFLGLGSGPVDAD